MVRSAGFAADVPAVSFTIRRTIYPIGFIGKHDGSL